ncbi:MAG: V-type ATP synthase subunit F [Arenicellales bacterium]|jgi:vacuolar-type H+-ATPase subunit F/Vma7
MGLRVAYVGERETGLGFRLVGAATYAPGADRRDVLEALHAAREQSDLVLLDLELSALVHDELDAMLIDQPVPPVVVLPGIKSDRGMPGDALARARQELGIG